MALVTRINQPYRRPLVFQVEGNSGRIGGTFTDDAGTGVVPSALTLLLYDVSTGTIINSRNRQNVLNANGVTVSAGGVFVWQLSAADNAILGTVPLEAHEQHLALFEWTFSGGQGKGEIDLRVVNLGQVPAS